MKEGEVLVFAVKTMPFSESSGLLDCVVRVTSQDGSISKPSRHSLSSDLMLVLRKYLDSELHRERKR